MNSCIRCLLKDGQNYPISFDKNGLCNYCQYYDTVVSSLGNEEQKRKWVQEKIQEIKKYGRKKSHDCILGVSGGVDSSYLAYWLTEQGIRPLLVHFDNGWNSELAQKNIENLCNKLGLDLYTYVVDWEEFREIQKAYFKADVVDIEVVTDHGIHGAVYEVAKKFNIKYLISGNNYATEAIMPKGWVFPKGDFTNLNDINNKFGTKKIKTFPHITFFDKLYYHFTKKFISIDFLNYIPYNKEGAKKILMEKLEWRDYGGKHYESVFTQFYQSYILPVKFNIDKRIAHYSNLICSGQMTREEAEKLLQIPPYDPKEIEDLKSFVIKKLEMTPSEFEEYLKRPPRSHHEFKTEEKYWELYFSLIKKIRFLKIK